MDLINQQLLPPNVEPDVSEGNIRNGTIRQYLVYHIMQYDLHIINGRSITNINYQTLRRLIEYLGGMIFELEELDATIVTHYEFIYLRILFILISRRVRESRHSHIETHGIGNLIHFIERERNELLPLLIDFNRQAPQPFNPARVFQRDHQAFLTDPIQRHLLDRWYQPTPQQVLEFHPLTPQQIADIGDNMQGFINRNYPWHSQNIIPSSQNERDRLQSEFIAEQHWRNFESRYQQPQPPNNPRPISRQRIDPPQFDAQGWQILPQELGGFPQPNNDDWAGIPQFLRDPNYRIPLPPPEQPYVPLSPSQRRSTSTENFDCPNCLDSYNSSETPYFRPPCDHRVCLTCMNEWGRTQHEQHREFTCPICRQIIQRR